MKILVTGGGGFLGTEICKQLLQKQHEVVSASRSHYPHLEELGVEQRKIDLSKSTIDLVGVDAVIHTAAKAGVWGSYDEFYQNNFISTQNILKASMDSGITKFVYTSSPSVVFGKDDIENADESIDYPSKFYTAYSETKAMAEKLVLDKNSSDFKTVAIRPHLIWGEGDPHLTPRLISKAKAGRLKVVGYGENLVDVIHVKNAAHAHVLALETLSKSEFEGGKAYFVGQERPVNLWDFINQILKYAGLDPVDQYIGFKTAYVLGGILEVLFKILGVRSPEPPMTRFVALQLAKHHYFSHKSAREDLGYAPIVSIEDGLKGLFKVKNENLTVIKEFESSAP